MSRNIESGIEKIMVIVLIKVVVVVCFFVVVLLFCFWFLKSAMHEYVNVLFIRF